MFPTTDHIQQTTDHTPQEGTPWWGADQSTDHRPQTTGEGGYTGLHGPSLSPHGMGTGLHGHSFPPCLSPMVWVQGCSFPPWDGCMAGLHGSPMGWDTIPPHGRTVQPRIIYTRHGRLMSQVICIFVVRMVMHKMLTELGLLKGQQTASAQREPFNPAPYKMPLFVPPPLPASYEHIHTVTMRPKSAEPVKLPQRIWQRDSRRTKSVPRLYPPRMVNLNEMD